MTVTPLITSSIVTNAAYLVGARGLCYVDYEGPRGELDPSAAVATVLGLPADVWCTPPGFVVETAEYQAGFRALYKLVEGLGYSMDLPEGERWDGEMLANHIAFWLEHDHPMLADVTAWMLATAALSDRVVAA